MIETFAGSDKMRFQKTSHSEYFLKFFQSLFFDFRSSDCITQSQKDSVDTLNEEFLGHRNVILPCFLSKHKRYLKAFCFHLYDLCQKMGVEGKSGFDKA